MNEIHLPPHHEQAERYAIGTLLNNPMSDQAANLYARMTPDDFYFSVNGKIFEHCKRLFIAGGQFDARTVYQELAKEAQESGGPAKDCTKEYLNELLELEVGNVEYYGQIISDKATRRRGIHLCTELIQRLRDTNEPSADIIAEFETRIFSITSEQPTQTTKHIADVMRSTLARIDERNTPGVKTDGIDTGFPVLNRWLSGGGWRPNRFVVIGARPGVGKTSIGISHAIAAAKAGFPTLFFSLEMTAEELAERMLAMEADIPLNKIIGDLQIDQHMGRMLNAASQQCSTQPIWIDDRESHNIDSLATVARRAVRKHGVKLIIVDYLQIMEHKSEGKGDAYYIRVGNTSRKLKQLAKQLGVALIALAQINRDSDNSERPTMSHIRDSGNIEQDADIVILLHPEPIPSGIAPGPVQKVELILDKQRAGPKAIVGLNYRRANVRFEQP